MKNRSLLISAFILLAAFLLVSCGTAPPANISLTPSPQPQGDAAEPALEPAPTTASQPTAEPLPGDYPAAEPALPPQPTYPPDYPGPPTMVPTVDPYPGGMAWIIRPVGIQCEEGTAPGYGDLAEAEATMSAAGIRVVDAEMIEMIVPTSCGSPTSAHFRLQIEAEDLDSALSFGWERGNN